MRGTNRKVEAGQGAPARRRKGLGLDRGRSGVGGKERIGGGAGRWTENGDGYRELEGLRLARRT